jgi:hypothetical protein
MKTFIPISLSYKPKILVQGPVYMVCKIFQFNLFLVFYQYLEFYNFYLGDSSFI